jgi:hypothetical protein
MEPARSDDNPLSAQEAEAGAVGGGRERGSDHGRRFNLRRPQLPTILRGQSTNTDTLEREESNTDGNKSPKRARFRLGLPRTRKRSESRPRSSQSTGPRSSSDSDPLSSFQRTRTERFPVITEPQGAHTRAEPQTSGGRRLFRGTDPAGMHLADLPDTSGRRRRARGDPSSSAREGEKPKRFMYCFPWIQSRRIRSQIRRCAASGLFLLMMLIVCKSLAPDPSYSCRRLLSANQIDLSLSITKNINNGEFTIMLVLIILFTTIFFCHGLIRLCMFIVRPKPSEDEEQPRVPAMFGPGGYAVPRRPIRVLLARDEEAAGLESETTKMQPPAYGLWRESVVRTRTILHRPWLSVCKPLLTILYYSEWTPIAYTGNVITNFRR